MGWGVCFQFDDEDNVYELMDDDQYGELVRQRRQREDFVVDDGTPPRPPPTLGPRMGLNLTLCVRGAGRGPRVL